MDLSVYAADGRITSLKSRVKHFDLYTSRSIPHRKYVHVTFECGLHVHLMPNPYTFDILETYDPLPIKLAYTFNDLHDWFKKNPNIEMNLDSKLMRDFPPTEDTVYRKAYIRDADPKCD